MLNTIVRGLFFRLLGYGFLVLGFWMLLQAFQRPSIPLGILGGLLIPGGMYLIVTARRGGSRPQSDDDNQGVDVDSVD